MVGEEIVNNYRPRSSSRSTTPATSTVRSPPETPTSFSNHALPPTPTSASAAAIAAAAAAAASVGVIDPRHFPMAPPSPFYGYPGLAPPFHPAFMPVNLVKAEMNNSGGLDTQYVAKNVRELLAIHNIGQRLFAKHVLGLSQGTVSELLSKPKSWDKLTEKGRESYRKMHAWATDDSNILALKAMSPKKSSSTPIANSQKEDNVTEERIASILSEAQQAMHAKKTAEQHVASAVVSSIYQMEMSRIAAANPHLVMAGTPLSPTSPSPSFSPHPNNSHHGHSNHSRKTKRDPDRYAEPHVSRSRADSERSQGESGGENSQEIVSRIYRQELEKLKNAAETAGNVAASSMYDQELDRLNQQSQLQKHMQDMALMEQERKLREQQLNGIAVKAEPPDSTSDDTASQTYGPIDLSSKPHSSSTHSSSSSPTEGMAGNGRHAGSAFFLVKPRVNGHDSGGESPHPPNTPGTPLGSGASSGIPESLSPLQRMQNIANSLTSRPNLGMPSNKPLRSVLPPITQEQFDCFANINTEDLVKKVKDALSQYSISQRLFGENVLGLSQGSVSDLLARPKPWHMLTQKGREPFIRMQIFLQDTEAIPKLVSSQYRIAPDKLMRSNSRNEVVESASTVSEQADRSYGSTTFPPSLPSPPPPPPPPQLPPPLLPPSPSSAPLPPPPHLPPPPPPPPRPHSASPLGLPPPSLPSRLPPPLQLPPKLQQQQQHQLNVAENLIGPLPPLPHPGLSPTAAQQRQWGYFAFPSSLLEVWAMTAEIETLALTARVKDVLQFHNLGQKLFGEAVLGLSQGSVSELLSKPKPWSMLSIKGREPFIKMHLWLSDPQNVEQLKYYQSQIKAHRRRKSSADERGFDSPTTPKRPRVFFTEEQKDILRAAYNQDPYPNQSTIESLASDLGVGVKTVINWFHNHRMRAKQQHHTGASSDGSSDVGNGAIKSEPADESSNHSDMSSVSGDASCQQAVAAAAAAAMRQVEASQWMFPQFEPVGLLQRKSSEEWDQDSLDDRMDETDGGSMRVKDEEGTSASPSTLSLPPPSLAPPAGVNKRKRSNPQRVYEGAQLERNKLQKAASQAAVVSVVTEEEAGDTISISEDVQEASTSCAAVPPQSSPSTLPEDDSEERGQSTEDPSLKSEREGRISKLEQGLEESAGWGDEGDDDSQDSIHSTGEKIQGQAKVTSALSTSALSPEPSTAETASNGGDDWEF
ncbi:homeobox protein cut-like isoform X1 [Littorina saxatilis]|uniref:homeobox protein cut-like isoform X1 n=1 Tax=Littorina saxatilis TaxID=31220 RepID=UPI0038B67550